jgi:hypothetical protein
MADMGLSYSRGYGLGQQDRAMDQESSNVYDKIYGNRKPMSGVIDLKREKTAKEMLEESKQMVLKTKALELENKERELAIKEMALNNAANRGLVTERTEDMRSRREFDQSRQGITDAEQRAEKARGVVTAEEDKRKNDLLKNAMRGFYTGDTQAIKEYFDTFGSQGVSIQDVIIASNGQIIVDFGDGKEVKFNSPREAIEKLLVPAQLIEQGIAGKMTEAQQKKAKQEDRGLVIEERRAGAYERSIDDLSRQRSGELTEKQRADMYDKAVRAYNDAIEKGVITKDDYTQDEYVQQYMKGAQGTGLNTAGTAEYQTKEDVRKAFKNGDISQDEALKILRDKFGMN